MIPIIIMIVSLFLDGLLSNYLPFLVNDLSLFTPMFTVVSIFILYPFFRKSEKKYYIFLFIVGVIYDLLYTNLVFLDGCLFVVLGFISYSIQKTFNYNYLKNILYAIIMVCSYEIIYAFILLVYNMVPITLSGVVYKISHSLIINIIYFELLYIIINFIPKKYKKISLN